MMSRFRLARTSERTCARSCAFNLLWSFFCSRSLQVGDFLGGHEPLNQQARRRGPASAAHPPPFLSRTHALADSLTYHSRSPVA
eukprot:1731983-Pleurochrysis_carterae.AAC.2